MNPTCYYLPLEPVASRYTYQLCNANNGWMPTVLREAFGPDNFVWVEGGGVIRPDVLTGAVLDAISRPRYGMSQSLALLNLIDRGKIKHGDAIYLQDLTTHGIEGVFYALHMHGLKVRVYAMVHANTFDQYDFSYSMRDWMRHQDLAVCNRCDGLFVASTVHKNLMKEAGVTSPIHVVGLPISVDGVNLGRSAPERTKQVAFTSRIDKEKNPAFMLEVAKGFLRRKREWTWAVTTSSASLRTYNNQPIIKHLRSFALSNKRFKIHEGLLKADYYRILAESSIQFNCSDQDFVSWTCLEALACGCDLVYPNFNSFPEFLPAGNLYEHKDVNEAVRVLEEHAERYEKRLGEYTTAIRRLQGTVLSACDAGRRKTAAIVKKGIKEEFCLWPSPR
jgi:glycosyltransferase involved in cell wall biosynthesis